MESGKKYTFSGNTTNPPTQQADSSYSVDQYSVDQYSVDQYSVDQYSVDQYSVDQYSVDQYSVDCSKEATESNGTNLFLWTTSVFADPINCTM